jgi:hypothetical protein
MFRSRVCVPPPLIPLPSFLRHSLSMARVAAPHWPRRHSPAPPFVRIAPFLLLPTTALLPAKKPLFLSPNAFTSDFEVKLAVLRRRWICSSPAIRRIPRPARPFPPFQRAPGLRLPSASRPLVVSNSTDSPDPQADARREKRARQESTRYASKDWVK